MDFFAPFINAYISMLGQPIMLLFTILSALQVYRGVQRVAVVRKRWNQWVAEPLQPWKRRIGEDIAFYIGVPIGVFIHELGHAIAVWMFGGRVLEFGFFFFWGFVLPDRVFPDVQEWIVSAAGTWGSLLFALIVAVAFWNHSSSAVRFAARRTARFQVYFALIYYPLFTAAFQFGDWRTIYDFDATPVHSGITAVVHAGLLLMFWYFDRTGRFDVPTFESAETASRYAQLAQSPNLSDKIERVHLLMRGNSLDAAHRLSGRLVEEHEDSAEAHILHALTAVQNLEQIPKKSAKYASRALALGLNGAHHRAFAHYLVGVNYRAEGLTAKAIDAYDHAIDSALESARHQKPVHPIYLFYYMRAIAYMTDNRNEAAAGDMGHAIQLAEARGQKDTAARFRKELELLQQRRR